VEQNSIREIKLHLESEFVLNLISFLSQEEDYSFVGNETELWLENLSHPKAQLVYIHHQKEFTVAHANYIFEKAKVITNRIKRTYLMPHLHVLILNVEKPWDITEINVEKDIGIVNVQDAESVKHSLHLEKYFPTIKEADLTMSLTDVATSVQYQTLEKTIRKAKLVSANGKMIVVKTYLLFLVVTFIYLLARSTLETTAFVAIRYGVAYPPLVLAGQYWRLFTSSFLHLEMLHLLLNAVFIFRFGSYVETAFGKLRTAFIILMSGLMSSLVGLAFSHHFTIGATGVAYGLLGAMVFLGFEERKTFMPMLRKLIFPILLVTLLMGMLSPQMGAFTHIGGTIGGFLAAAMVGLAQFKPFYLRSLLTAVTFIILASGLMMRGSGRPMTVDMERFNNDLVQYYEERGDLDRANELRRLFEIEVE